MSFPRYPKYKPSGVEWLDLLPEAWSTIPLGKLTEPERPIMYGIVLPGPDVDAGVPIVKGGNVKPDRLRLSNLCRTTSEIERPFARARLRGGDIVIAIRGSYGDAEIVPDELDGANITQDVARIAPDSGVNNRWLLYALRSDCVFRQLDATASGATIRGLNIFNLKRAGVPVPPLPEQRAIAAFLDRETAKIDALVAEQERLIELMAEKRQAAISHAVTKGLDPAAPMKPSGVEWLGDVPAHWAIAPVGSRYAVQLGKMLDTAQQTGKHLRPYLRVLDVQWGKINLVDLPTMDFDEDDRQKFRLRDEDLLVNEGGSYPGRSAIWRGEIAECYFQKALHRLRPWAQERDCTSFMYFVMRWAAEFGVFSAGGMESTIEHLPAERLRRYRFVFPTTHEQRAIARFLHGETENIDTLVAEAEKGIELLKERRSALISAAVTGQIDVRNAVPEGAA